MKSTIALLPLLLLSILVPVSCDSSIDLPGAGNKLTPVAKKKPLLSGYVVDEAGSAVAGVAVRVFSPIKVTDLQILSGETDGEGYFEFDVESELGTGDGVPLFLELRKEWFLPAQHQLSAWRAGRPKSVDITLPPAGAATGRVVDEDYRPVVGAFVFALPPDVPGVERRNSVPSTVTDAQGRFRLADLPIRGMDIGVLAEGYTPALKGTVNVLAKVAKGLGDITLTPGNRMAGEVRTLAGTPINGALVHAFRQQEFRNFEIFGRAAAENAGATVRTGADGRFLITTLAPGSYTVEAEAPGHRIGEASLRDVQPGRTDLVLTLEPIREIELTVFDGSSNLPISAWDLTLVTESMRMKPVTKEEVRSRDGIHKVVVSEGATYRLTITAEGYVPHEMTLTVTGDFSRSLRVPLKKD